MPSIADAYKPCSFNPELSCPDPALMEIIVRDNLQQFLADKYPFFVLFATLMTIQILWEILVAVRHLVRKLFANSASASDVAEAQDDARGRRLIPVPETELRRRRVAAEGPEGPEKSVKLEIESDSE